MSTTTTPTTTTTSPTAAPVTSSKRPALLADAPWRYPYHSGMAARRPVPRIHYNPVVRVESQDPTAAYALAVMRHSNPIGEGFAMEAALEGAGPDCIVPGQAVPVRLLGVKLWPLDINFKFMEPVGRELRSVVKFLDSAGNLTSSSFQDR